MTGIGDGRARATNGDVAIPPKSVMNSVVSLPCRGSGQGIELD